MSFKGEEGLDAGYVFVCVIILSVRGLRRELYTLLAQSLFSPQNGLFVVLSERRAV